MAVKNTAQVVIGGKIITLGGYESEEYFQKVASYINNKIAELSEMPGYSRQPMETKHTLLSLNCFGSPLCLFSGILKTVSVQQKREVRDYDRYE